jgi:hypothetical protein
MISSISGPQSTPGTTHHAQQLAQPAAKGNTLPEDTVSISPHANAATASADVDHDGDSH